MRAEGGTPREDVRRFLSLLHEPGATVEVRIPKHGTYNFTASCYFDDVDAARRAVEGWDGRANVYVTLNPVAPALLARAANRIADRAEGTTADDQVLRRRWLLLAPARATSVIKNIDGETPR
jgi:hypothetical protein